MSNCPTADLSLGELKRALLPRHGLLLHLEGFPLVLDDLALALKGLGCRAEQVVSVRTF